MQKNALREFKENYVKTTLKADVIDDAVTAQMGMAYDDASNAIYRILTQARLNDSYATKKGRDTAQVKIEKVLVNLKNKLTNTLRSGVWEMAGAMAEAAQRDLELLGVADEETLKVMGPPSMGYINTTFQDSFAHVAAQTGRMADSVRRELQRDTAEISRRVAVEGLSRPQAYRALRDKVLERQPEFKFIDKAGKQWDSKTYFDMLSKTTMKNAMRETYVDQLVKAKHDLVSVSRHGTKCRLCMPWEGEILSLTGATPGYYTLDQVKANGLFHPRCKHRLLAYHPEIKEALKKL